ENQWISERIWGKTARPPLVSQRIHELAGYLKSTLYEFVRQFDISLLILENALSIPMHIPLGAALTEYLAETEMPAIAHHHDFYWERSRFLITAVDDYLEMAFPPRGGGNYLQHAVINQSAREELAWRKGVPATLIPNVLDFEHPPPPVDPYASDVRTAIGLGPDDVMILQPTRVVPRKGIEYAIQLVQMLGDPKYKLVVSHEAGDEGFEYRNRLLDLAQEEGVDLRFVATRIGHTRHYDSEGNKIYTLWDLYPHADLVTYLSLYEGFGNAFLEAVYFRVPIFVNRYSIFIRDIEPKGFRVPAMDGFLTRQVVEEVRRLLEDRDYRQKIVDHNYAVASRFYSYGVLRRKLCALIANVKGQE
ncbi:MAG: glycosyltransferase, partial [Nitrospinota bacterium]